MKLRTTHNSIRIRIRKSELTTLQAQQRVEESIQFPNGVTFKFVLAIDKTANSVTTQFQDNQLTVVIPTTEAKNWITTNQVGIEKNIAISDNDQLHLLIEKDFPCTDRENEDKSDTFWELATDMPEKC